MSKVKLNFSTNAKLEKLIGRELITSNIIAIFELIKNSYDAAASEAVIRFQDFDIDIEKMNAPKIRDMIISKDTSKIIIYDNGRGMSFEEVQKKWMEIGTTSKEDILEDFETHRAINGEKGIGRFGTDKLGAMLKLISVGAGGYEKTILTIDWNAFDDHERKNQDFTFDCEFEELFEPEKTGLRLEISELRDKWSNGDVLKLKRHLRKLVSPFVQEQGSFQIFLDYEMGKMERVVNDSFDYANTWIEANIDTSGRMWYEIVNPLECVKKELFIAPPKFGPIKLKIYYMDRAAKSAFTKGTGVTTAEYGNIKVFRDDFRVLPYGEKENDWLGIDNRHAQGMFRTFGTRDLVGYVQITKSGNPILKDTTSRQGLNEDTVEFEAFKEFIWMCIILLQDAVFNQIKKESEKQGRVIEDKVKNIRSNILDLQHELPNVYEGIAISEEDKIKLSDRINKGLVQISSDVMVVEQANKQLSSRVKVMEKIVGSENRMYDMLHAVKNRLGALKVIVEEFQKRAEEYSFEYDYAFAERSIHEISSIVLSAMRRSSPKRKKRDTIILSSFIEEFIEENQRIYPAVHFDFKKEDYSRIFVNIEELKISLENLLDNAVKAMNKEEVKIINIYLEKGNGVVNLYFDDNGIGVDNEYAPFIFNVSYSKTGGTGIGLANVLDFMKEESGDINLMEEGTLKGASFRLTFPLKGVKI